jgi:integrase
MARTLNRLTALKVKRLKEPGLYSDGGNLWLQVSPWGTKSWVLRYMLGGRARKMGLGSLNDFTLLEARERARLLRQKLADGIDPIEDRLKRRDEMRREEAGRITFKDAANKFLSVHEQQWRNEKHRKQWRSTLQTYAFPTLGERPVEAIDAALINRAVAGIWKDTPETASRVKQRIERVCQWVRDGMPLPQRGAAKRVKHHSAMSYEDLPAFMVRLRERNSISALALEFCILTAARTNEVINAKWSEIDLKKAVWVIPAERMKANKEHVVPLSDRAVEILRQLPRGSFAFRSGGHRTRARAPAQG